MTTLDSGQGLLNNMRFDCCRSRMMMRFNETVLNGEHGVIDYLLPPIRYRRESGREG
jgi:hypothetical protein